ncbi:MAG: response regulator [bacterium]|nr:response regulator [bacterium]
MITEGELSYEIFTIKKENASSTRDEVPGMNQGPKPGENISTGTEQTQPEESPEYLNRVPRALRNINQLIVREKETGFLIRKACEILTADQVYQQAWITLIDDAGDVVTTAGSGYYEDLCPTGDADKHEPLTPCAQKALKQQGALGIHKPSNRCDGCTWSINLNGKGAVTARLEHDDKVFGLLTASLDARLTTDREQQDLFRNIADDIGFALHHIEQEKERCRAEVLQKAVYRISQTVESAENLDALFRAVHEIIRGVMPADNFYIAHYHEQDDLLTFPYFADTVDEPPKPRKAGRGLTEYVLRTGKSLLSSVDVQEKLKKKGEIELIGAPCPIWLGVPLKADEKTIGIIAVQDYSDPGAYGKRELHMLEYVSTQVAKAIEQKRAGDALRMSEDLNRGIVANTPIGIVYLDKEGIILYTNPAMEIMTDVPEGETSKAVGKRMQDIPNIKDAGADELVRSVLAGENINNVQLEYKSIYGKNLTLKIHAAPRRGTNGEIIGAIVMCQDISGYKKLEAQFLQAQKMEAVGRLAGGVAHDFNNLLTVIFGHAELGLMALNKLGAPGTPDETAGIRKHFREIVSTADRTTELIDQLLSFSRKKVIKPRIIDLNDHLGKMERMLQRLIGEDVELKFIRKPGLGMVKAEPAQLDQVVVNLAVNARDAMPQGGKLTIETINIEMDQRFVAEHVGAVPGAYIQLSVSDTGHGISPDIMGHIFDPFFTTKQKDKGTGLGLATVYGIVKQNGGFVTCYSEQGLGTTFKIYLPRAEEMQNTLQTAAKEVHDPTGKETILVVEDEKAVRDLAVETLKQFGYDVLEATNGSDALKLCRNMSKDVDLVLTDVVMPSMNGPEFIRQVREFGRDLKVLYMSGYTENSIANRGILESDSEYISKPFRPQELIATVRKVLDKE